MISNKFLKRMLQNKGQLVSGIKCVYRLALLLIIAVLPTNTHAQASQAMPAIIFILMSDESTTPAPEEDVYLELTWSTPGDPDENDIGPNAGSDLDIHYAHANAIHPPQPDNDGDGELDPWFELPFDTFWFNRNPNWGNVAPMIDDNPIVVRDDTDGAGPEVITHNNPENTIYQIGVHAHNDHGFGDSTATIKVWISGVQVYSSAALLTEEDMWWVGEINWASGLFTPHVVGAGMHRITPNYASIF